MRTTDTDPPLGNPIAQLPGAPSFVVQAPPFPGGAGNLRISPANDEIATFTTYRLQNESTQPALPNGTLPWNDFAVPACVDDVTTATSNCWGAVLDSGTPSTEVPVERPHRQRDHATSGR